MIELAIFLTLLTVLLVIFLEVVIPSENENLVIETPTEYSKKTKTKKTNIYPEGVVSIDMDFFSGSDRLTNSSYNGLLDSFTTKSFGDLSPVHKHGFELLATCAAQDISDLATDTYSTMQNSGSKWFAYLENLTPDQLRALLKCNWRTRPNDYQAKIDLAALTYVAKRVAAMLLGYTRGQVNKWALQANKETNDWLPIVHNTEDNKTWRAHLIGTLFGTITGADKVIVRKTINDLLQYEWKFPAECFEEADKLWGGYVELPYMNEHAKLTTQVMHIFMGDSLIVDTPKTGDTETDYMYTIMTNLSKFFIKLERTSRKYLYGPDSPEWKEWEASIALQPVTEEWVTTWPRMEIPWPFYWLRTHYDDVNTQYEFILPDHVDGSLLDFVDTAIFTRVKSDNSDVGYYLEAFLLPGYTWEQCKAAILWGWWFCGGYLDTDLAHDGSYELDVDISDRIAYYEAVETIDENSELFEVEGVDAYLVSDLNSDQWYGYSPFNAIKDGDDSEDSLFANMFKPRLLQESEVSDPTAKASPITHDNSNKKIQIANELYDEYMSRRFTKVKLAAEFINRTWTRKSIMYWHNPIDAPDQSVSPPERSSKLTSSDYHSSTDKAELEKFIKDLRAEVEFFNTKGVKDQVKNRQSTIERVEKHIKELAEKKEPEKPVDSNPAEAPTVPETKPKEPPLPGNGGTPSDPGDDTVTT
jgi:hypothetical protein